MFLRLMLEARAKLRRGNAAAGQHKCYRGIPKDMVEDSGPCARYEEGDEVFWWGFSSCTRNARVLESPQFFGDKGERTLFTVEARGAVDISEYSLIPREEEVLLFPGTMLEVSSRLRMGPGLWLVQLSERSPPPGVVLLR